MIQNEWNAQKLDNAARKMSLTKARPVDPEKIRIMLGNGLTLQEAGAFFGVSKGAIAYWGRKLSIKTKHGSSAARFQMFVSPEPNSGCHLWDGAAHPKGYGCFRSDGKTIRATRFSLICAGVPVPDGACVLHRCDLPACVNPEHLFVGTQLENVTDMIRKGRAVMPPNARG